MRVLLGALILTVPAVAQSNNISKQIALIKQLLPNSSSMGVLINPRTSDDIDFSLGIAASENGIQVVKAEVRNIRDISTAMRAVTQRGVDFVLLLEDRVITSKNAVKYVVKQTVRQKIPVFTQGEEGLAGGAFGTFKVEGPDFKLIINNKVKGRFDITIPENDAKISVQ